MKSCGLFIQKGWTIGAMLIIFIMSTFLTASPLVAQTILTPTPNAEGVILIEVKANDTLWAIAANAGLSLDELLQLNNLNENSIVQPGQLLILGYATPVPTATPIPPTLAASATMPPPPTETAVFQPASGICLLAFEDTNGDGAYHPGEPLKRDVAFTVFNEHSVILNYITDGFSEPACFENMAPGAYQITRSRLAQERLTTPGNRGIVVQSGSVVELLFGSSLNAEMVITSNFNLTPVVPTRLPLGAAADQEISAETEPANAFSLLLLVLMGIGLLLVFVLLFIIMRLITLSQK